MMWAQRSPDWATVTSRRLMWYNPKLDPYVIAQNMRQVMAEACEDGRYEDGTVERGGPLHRPDTAHPENLVSSLCEDGRHRLALDVDTPLTEIRSQGRSLEICWHHDDQGHRLVIRGGLLVASSTRGNWHLYGPHDVYQTTDEYLAALAPLAATGLIEETYLAASKGRQQTLLRPPHIRKTITRHAPVTSPH